MDSDCNIISRWKSSDRAMPVDELDMKILCALRKNARISNLELAKELGVSEATVRRRIRILEEKGIIKGYAALIDCHAVENSIKAFITIKVDKNKRDEIAKKLMEESRVMTLYRVLGEYDLLCECLFMKTEELQEFLDNKLKMDGIISTVTYVVFKAYKSCQWSGL